MKCPAGYHMNDTKAQTCSSCATTGMYADEAMQSDCKSCPSGMYANKKSTACEKPPYTTVADCKGFETGIPQYLDDTAPEKEKWNCVQCPNGGKCDAYTTIGQIRSRQGYWRVPWSKHNITFEKCLEESACLGASEEQAEPNNKSIVEGCAPLYNPPLCAACARGSYKDAGSFKCLACFDDQSQSIWFMVFIVFMTLAVIAGFTLATVKDGGQASAVDVVILKIAINSGIISAGASRFPLYWPPAVMSMFEMYAIISASAIGDSLSADCVLRASETRPVQAWGLAMAVIPPAVVLLWFLLFGVMSLMPSKKKINYLKVHFPVAVIVTLLFAHPVVTKSAVKLVACRTVAGRVFLDADFNISCDSTEYRLWANAVAIPLFICFTFGVPLFYALAMYRHVRTGTLATYRDIYGFLFSGFRKDIWWFELWNTLRKSLFTISAVLFAPMGAMLQTWAALVLLLFFLAIFLISQPYEQAYLNNLEQSALGTNVITLLLGLGLYTNNRPGVDKSESLNVLITLSIVCLNIFFAMHVLYTYLMYSQYCTLCKKNKNLVDVAPTVVVPSGTDALTDNTNNDVAIRIRGTVNQKKSYRTSTAEEIQKTHQKHRDLAIQNIEKQQKKRRGSLKLRVQARAKVKHANVLSTSIYFSNLDNDSISKIIDAMDCLVLEENNYEICRQGDVADIFYCIVSGTCNVTIDGVLVTVLNEFDVFGEQALFEDPNNGASIRGATVTTTDGGNVQVLTLSKVKFDRLIASGTLNEECVKTLKFHTAKRIQNNEQQRIKNNEQQRIKNNEQQRIASIQHLMKKTVKNVKNFRKIIGKLVKRLKEQKHHDDVLVVDSNTRVKKAMFQLVLQKIIGMEVRNNDSDIVGLEKKASDELIDSILLSIYSTQGEVSCGTLEKWMKLDVIIQGRKEADEADQTVEVEGGSVTKRTLINVARLQTRLKRVRKLQQSRRKNKKK